MGEALGSSQALVVLQTHERRSVRDVAEVLSQSLLGKRSLWRLQMLLQGNRNTGLTVLLLLESLGGRDALLPLDPRRMSQSLLDLGEALLLLHNLWMRRSLLLEGLRVGPSLGDGLAQALLQLQALRVDHVLLWWSFHHSLRGTSEVMSRLRKV